MHTQMSILRIYIYMYIYILVYIIYIYMYVYIYIYIYIVRAPPLPPTPDVRKITLFTGFRTPKPRFFRGGPPKVDATLTQG